MAEDDLVSSMWRSLVGTGDHEEDEHRTTFDNSSSAMDSAQNDHPHQVAVVVVAADEEQDHRPLVYKEEYIEPSNYWIDHPMLQAPAHYTVAAAGNSDGVLAEDETSVEMQQALSNSLQQVKDIYCVQDEDIAAMDYWNQVNQLSKEQDSSKVEVEKLVVDGETHSPEHGDKRSDEERKIFKVIEEPQVTKDSNYPQFMFIGLHYILYDRDKPEVQILKRAENYKWTFYKNLRVNKKISWRKCRPEIQAVLDDVKSYYIDLEKKDFEEKTTDDEILLSLFYDACFILAYFRILPEAMSESKSDPSPDSELELQQPSSSPRSQRQRENFYRHIPMEYIINDISLVGNQIPFIVIQKVYDASPDKDEQGASLRCQVVEFLKKKLLHTYPTALNADGKETEEFNHFLHYYHMYFTPSILLDNDKENSLTINQNKDSGKGHQWPRAKDLVDVSVTLKNMGKENGPYSLLDISFDKGVLRIPTLVVDHHTKLLFRNIIAFEKELTSSSYPSNRYYNYFTSYVKFITDLTTTQADVTILLKNQILQNKLGKDEEVLEIFSKLRKSISIDLEHTYLKDTFSKLEKFRGSPPRTRIWMADLHETYLGTPWKVIGLVAGTIILVCTIIGAVYNLKGSGNSSH